MKVRRDSALLWRSFLNRRPDTSRASRPPRPMFSWPASNDPKRTHSIQDRLQVYRQQLIIQFRRVQLDKNAADEATKGNRYRVPIRKNSLRPAHLPGPSALCKLPEVKVFRRGDEPFRAQGSDLYFPLTTPQAFNTCAIVSSAGSILKSHLGREIDAHDVVLRFNNAPAGGFFAEDVGSRTTHRVINSQVVTKPEFEFFDSPLYRNITLLVWDPSGYQQQLDKWVERPEHDLFSLYFLRRQILPDEELLLVDPRSLWQIWDFINDNSPLPVVKNPPSSGLIGLAYMVRRCKYVNFYEYIPSIRLTKRCHYYAEQEDLGCTTGVWHPLAAEKMLVLNLTTNNNHDIFEKGRVSFSRDTVCVSYQKKKK
ncbi:beta-galactoside alpha-2,6-sialyltransferase 2-like isoform X2 [Varroa destructor]|uniref:Beta-galactoside alpha-2,6-sialyltransferase 1 n=1 Tax=Varroa destructor TaxID=109461 RepID=A0A7M7KNY6_VARDE|nr:beta-galactoside alpha-2,6-sialyltransferase 2-like isoform X2 [Varroa destructor]XP_022669786.1 beta-galactoside alpha-2,6-sialyltransferase 2-like isoform X2 [Varroa destructor]